MGHPSRAKYQSRRVVPLRLLNVGRVRWVSRLFLYRGADTIWRQFNVMVGTINNFTSQMSDELPAARRRLLGGLDRQTRHFANQPKDGAAAPTTSAKP